MPRRRFIDKKAATTFQLVHRAQNDPLLHDQDASPMVFAEKQQQQQQRRRPTEDDYVFSGAQSNGSGRSFRSQHTKQRGDLEDEFGMAFQKNEGEAAQHGVFFDDTEYDYMQHMRDIGTGVGTVTWVEARPDASETKKGKVRLEDALRTMDLDDARSVGTSSSNARSLLPEEVLPSDFVKKMTYQDQQDIPDEIAGFQPDMNPRLREVLEALDDEEYVDEDDGIFSDIIDDGYEVEKDEWERMADQTVFEDNDDDDEGWQSDDTIRAPASAKLSLPEGGVALPPPDALAQPPSDPTEGAWLNEFNKFKSAAKAEKSVDDGHTPNKEASSLHSLASGPHKRRKGAKTNPTNYSMTSSSLIRTDQQRLLDARFDQLLSKYTEDIPEDDDEVLDDVSAMSGMTGLSASSNKSKWSNASGISSYSKSSDPQAPKLVRSDFDGIVDEFLGSYSKVGKSGRRVKRGVPQTGMQQLDEIRTGLGPARLSGRSKKGA